MTLDLERKQQRLDRYTITGLGALSIGSFAGAAHQAVLDGFLTAGTPVQTTLSVISVAGLVLFGVAFTALYVMGRRLDQREPCGDTHLLLALLEQFERSARSDRHLWLVEMYRFWRTIF